MSKKSSGRVHLKHQRTLAIGRGGCNFGGGAPGARWQAGCAGWCSADWGFFLPVDQAGAARKANDGDLKKALEGWMLFSAANLPRGSQTRQKTYGCGPCGDQVTGARGESTERAGDING